MNALLLIVLPLAPEPSPEPPGGAGYCKDPQAVFEAYEKATQKRDYKTVIDCIAPAARKDYAAQIAVQALLLKGSRFANAEKAVKPMLEVMAKHGLTEKALADITVSSRDRETVKKAQAGLGKLIKRPEAFALEMLAAKGKMLKALSTGRVVRRPPMKRPPMKLEDVKVEWDKASGTMVIDLGGRQLKRQVDFLKGPNGWRMLPPTGPYAGGTRK